MSKALQYGPELTLASLLDIQSKGTSRQINCHQVGEIVSFNPETQTAEVKVKMSFLLNGEIKEYPLLLDCPCVVLSGGSGRLTMPISPGDSCLVLFNDRDIDNWYAGGQTMPPRTDRLHDFSDAIALVGIRNRQNQITDYLNNGVELKYGNATIKLQDNQMTITSPYINVNGNVNVVQNTVDDNSLHAYIISSYVNGTSWYRVYSDGWCEQGGKYFNNNTPVAFLKQFKDTNYSVLTQCTDANPNDGIYASCWTNKTVAGFTGWITYGTNHGSGVETDWYAFGYVA